MDAMRVALTGGGSARVESVANALANVCEEAELVCMHDAVRPCITQELIDAVFQAAARTGAAILADRVHGTLKKVSDDGNIEQTISRNGLWEAQTPQVFRKALLKDAQANWADEQAPVTDDAQLVEAMGRRVTVVPGDPRNIKITTPADLALAETILARLGAAE